MALAIGTNISSLDSLSQKPHAVTVRTLTCSGLQLAKQLDAIIVRVVITKVVDYVFGFLPSQVFREIRRAKKANELLGLLIT